MNYCSYSLYLKEKYGGSSYRVSVDGGFSCPNRGKGRGGDGCIFCDEMGSRAVYLRNDNGSYPESLDFQSDGEAGYPPEWSPLSVESQVQRGIDFLIKRYQARDFLLYFQAYSGTDSSVGALKGVYDHALSLVPFKELIVSTRPDCIDEEKADLLASYKTPQRDVWCELGLQTASDRLLEWIQRGHSLLQFTQAFQLLRSRGIKIAVHLITGLPTETSRERDATIQLMQELHPEGVKIHNLNIPQGTKLHRIWKESPFPVAEMDEHIETLIYYLRRLPSDTLIMRMTCDTDKERLVLPKNKWNKSQLLQKLNQRMIEEGVKQGDLFKS